MTQTVGDDTERIYSLQDYIDIINNLPNNNQKSHQLTVSKPPSTDLLVQSPELDQVLAAIQSMSKERKQIMQDIRQAEIVYQYGESAQFKTVFYFVAQKIKTLNYLSERKEQHNSDQS